MFGCLCLCLILFGWSKVQVKMTCINGIKSCTELSLDQFSEKTKADGPKLSIVQPTLGHLGTAELLTKFGICSWLCFFQNACLSAHVSLCRWICVCKRSLVHLYTCMYWYIVGMYVGCIILVGRCVCVYMHVSVCLHICGLRILI